eukprot:1529156-Rhodomonas_salina.2
MLKEGAAGARKMMRWMTSTVLDCCRVVYRKGGISDPQLERRLAAMRMWMFVLKLIFGSRTVTANTSRAAMALLLQGVNQEERVIDSAVATLSNRNVTVMADRLVASFGVVCAQRGVVCEAATVTRADILKGARTVNVMCVKGSEGVGVSAATRRRVKVVVEAFQASDDAVGAALQGTLLAVTTGALGENWYKGGGGCESDGERTCLGVGAL